MRQVDMTRLDLSTGKAEKTKDCVAEEVPLQITTKRSLLLCHLVFSFTVQGTRGWLLAR